MAIAVLFLTCRYFNKGAHYSFIAQSAGFWFSTPQRLVLHHCILMDEITTQFKVKSNFTEFYLINELWKSKQ